MKDKLFDIQVKVKQNSALIYRHWHWYNNPLLLSNDWNEPHFAFQKHSTSLKWFEPSMIYD